MSRNEMSEKQIEDYLFENPAAVDAFEWFERQWRIPSGRLDLFGVHMDGQPYIVEVKARRLKERDLAQVVRYGADVCGMVSRWKRNHSRYIGVPGRVRLALVGTGVARNVYHSCAGSGVFVYDLEIVADRVASVVPVSYNRQDRADLSFCYRAYSEKQSFGKWMSVCAGVKLGAEMAVTE